jgi:hypothetical protein
MKNLLNVPRVIEEVRRCSEPHNIPVVAHAPSQPREVVGADQPSPEAPSRVRARRTLPHPCAEYTAARMVERTGRNTLRRNSTLPRPTAHFAQDLRAFSASWPDRPPRWRPSPARATAGESSRVVLSHSVHLNDPTSRSAGSTQRVLCPGERSLCSRPQGLDGILAGSPAPMAAFTCSCNGRRIVLRRPLLLSSLGAPTKDASVPWVSRATEPLPGS